MEPVKLITIEMSKMVPWSQEERQKVLRVLHLIYERELQRFLFLNKVTTSFEQVGYVVIVGYKNFRRTGHVRWTRDEDSYVDSTSPTPRSHLPTQQPFWVCLVPRHHWGLEQTTFPFNQNHLQGSVSSHTIWGFRFKEERASFTNH